MILSHSKIETLFTPSSGGAYHFARWGRPIAPIIFGVQDETLTLVKSTVQAMCMATGHSMAETDPHLGSNFMMFFFSGWQELLGVPDLGKMIPNLDELVPRLAGKGANQYRAFRFDDDGSIQACFVFLRMDAALAEIPADMLIMDQVVQSMLLWSDCAFSAQSPLAVLENGTSVVRPEITDVMRVGYDPIMPAAAQDSSHAMRLWARLQKGVS